MTLAERVARFAVVCEPLPNGRGIVGVRGCMGFSERYLGNRGRRAAVAAASDLRAALGGLAANLATWGGCADGSHAVAICGEPLPGAEPLADAQARHERIVARLAEAIGGDVADDLRAQLTTAHVDASPAERTSRYIAEVEIPVRVSLSKRHELPHDVLEALNDAHGWDGSGEPPQALREATHMAAASQEIPMAFGLRVDGSLEPTEAERLRVSLRGLADRLRCSLPIAGPNTDASLGRLDGLRAAAAAIDRLLDEEP